MSAHLRIVDGDFRSDERHSVRVDALTAEQVADLEHITRNVLAPGQEAMRELADALRRRDRDMTIAAQRRLLAVALTGRELANRLERDEAWLTHS